METNILSSNVLDSRKVLSLEDVNLLLSQNTNVVFDENSVLMKKHALAILDAEKDNLTKLEYTMLKEVLCWIKIPDFKTSTPTLILDNKMFSDLYMETFKNETDKEYISFVSTLIETSGLIMLYLKGNCSIKKSEILGYIDYPNINKFKVLRILNKCLISSSSLGLYEGAKNTVDLTINKICNLNFNESFTKLPNSYF